MKVLAWLVGVATLVAACAYMVVSLNRWEWNRALFFGLIFVMAELALGIALVLRELARVAARVEDDTLRQVLREGRPMPPDRFAWLRESVNRTNVFITFFIGGGVLVSGLAWVIDRLAARTWVPARERQLAGQLGAVAYPPGGLLVDDMTVLAQDVPGADDAQLRQLLRRPRL